MPVDLDDLTEKVRDQIAGLFPSAGGTATPILAFEPVGLPIPASAFELPNAPGVVVPVLARRRVSALANQVPAVNGDTYQRTAFQIDEFYQYLINAMTPSGGASVGPLSTLLMQARQLYAEGSELDPLNADDTLYPVDAEPADWYRPDATHSWTAFRFTTTPPPRTLFDATSGTATIRGTFSFSFDSGTETTAGDVWWQQMTASTRALVAKKSARLADLGEVDFDQLGPETLITAPLNATSISGSDDTSDRLQVGRVFAVRTNGGRYAKVQVVGRHQEPGSFYMLKVRWVTYIPVAVPANPAAGPTAPRVTFVKSLATGPTAPAVAPRARFKWAKEVTQVVPAPAPLSATALRHTTAEFRSRNPVVPTAKVLKLHHLAMTRPALATAPTLRVDVVAPAQAEGIELEFELLPVTLNRPWMMLGLLADRQWFIPGYRAGEYGRTLLPALPTAMLVARNVKVSVTGSPDDTPLQAVGFGPFSLAGRTATRQNAAAGQTSATLASPAPQVIGWLVQPLNGLAPLSDPSLPPE